MVDETLPTRPPLYNDPSAAPWGMLNYDRGALSYLQQEGLNSLKTPSVRLDRRQYLSSHPQVSAILSVILRDIFLKRPENPMKFAAAVVESPNFEEEVNYYLKRNRPSRKKKKFPYQKSVFSCIDPNLLSGKQMSVDEEKKKIYIDFPDEDVDSITSSESEDSFKEFSNSKAFCTE